MLFHFKVNSRKQKNKGTKNNKTKFPIERRKTDPSTQEDGKAKQQKLQKKANNSKEQIKEI